ncbi:MAG: response regulator transcription factor [Chloroflexota bacterium]|nr:response regulator transcription factor [Chloroflexota bacterium]
MTSAAQAVGRVLVIDDEPQIRRLLTVALTSHGYWVESAATGEVGLDRLVADRFDLLLLDLGLPEMDGIEVCRHVREWSTIPIIVISVRDTEGSKIAALDLGADDYITKPFGIGELLARMRACLRRIPSGPDAPLITIGPLSVDLAKRRVVSEGRDIRLTPTEYDLLRVLSLHAGRVVTHRQLLREARGPTFEEETPLLRVHMVGLRQKLGIRATTPGYIATEPGVGYRLLE